MLLSFIPVLRKKFTPAAATLPAADAYDLWASVYDNQPGNLMLSLDEQVFTELLGRINPSNAHIIDIGCGTGRHWQKIVEKKPATLTGADVSAKMLEELKLKFPFARVEHITNIKLNNIPTASCDIIVSTLTIAHIENITELFTEWQRILKPGGDILLTDFHPGLLAKGGKRNFFNNGREVIIKNYVHSLDQIKLKAFENNFYPVFTKEMKIDKSMIQFYHEANALHVYERYKGSPVIYGMHLKKNYAAE
ncbi:MAG: hypothetical protein JWN76_1101 [Chitinophagaceae bacterium]|nr:hypothetical protein [Chitinophagaceae bacterium]